MPISKIIRPITQYTLIYFKCLINFNLPNDNGKYKKQR